MEIALVANLVSDLSSVRTIYGFPAIHYSNREECSLSSFIYKDYAKRQIAKMIGTLDFDLSDFYQTFDRELRRNGSKYPQILRGTSSINNSLAHARNICNQNIDERIDSLVNILGKLDIVEADENILLGVLLNLRWKKLPNSYSTESGRYGINETALNLLATMGLNQFYQELRSAFPNSLKDLSDGRLAYLTKTNLVVFVD